MDKLTMEEGRYSMYKDDFSGIGECGPMLQSHREPETYTSLNELIPEGENGDIIVGCRLQCGAPWSSWWMTSTIMEIFDVNEDKTECKVKTKSGNTYEVRRF